jgi:glycosyltransferase involved in cell wall biosynthesis
MKRVCHLSSAHRGLDIRIFRKECVSLANAGYDTHLVINASAADVAEAATYGVTVHPLKYVPETHRLSRMLLHTQRCYLLARRLNADVYHLHDPELIPYGLLLAWSGKKVIFDSHEDLPGEILSKDWVPLWARRGLAAMCRTLQDFAARRISAVVAATPYIRTRFENSARHVAVINNFPLMDELSSLPLANCRERDSVCYVGGIDAIRGIREMVQAIAATPSNLLLAGRFDTEELRNDVRKHAGWKNVKEYGFVDRQRVSEILAQSFSGLVTLYGVPNFINSQPIKMFEYMSAGVPVIASDFPLWREVIEGNQCGICVNQSDPEEIAAAIRHLRDHPEEVVRMGNNGRQAVEKKYRWDLEEVKLVSLYRSLLDVYETER